MRKLTNIFVAAILIAESCGPLWAQDWEQTPVEVTPVAATPVSPLQPEVLADCQVVARIDGQVVLACDVAWQINSILEENRERIPPQQYEEVRQQLTKRHIASLVDTKLLYAEFRRNVPPENMPQIEENLMEPFQERDVPRLIEQLKVKSEPELERELLRLGSSLADARRTFNEKAIASEWLRSKVKINEEVNPADMLEYYQAHLADYEFPTQCRWEELMVRKNRFNHPRQAYAALAQLGNQVWPKVAANPNSPEQMFAELAKAKSDGFNAKDGGVHGWTTKGALKAKAVDAMLFSVGVGQMSPIVESESGFHIVRVLERKEAGRKPFTEVQPAIRDQLKEERFRQGVEKYITQLRKDARIWTVYTGPVTADVLMGRVPEGTTQR